MFKPDEAQSKALEVWYDQDHPLHLDPLHPAIGLAGEAGELLDLYKKERFKDGVSWWDCKHCGENEDWHSKNNSWCGSWWRENEKRTVYTPLILDELGDLWYYLRILAYQFELPMAYPLLETRQPEIEVILCRLFMATAIFLETQIMLDKHDRTKKLNDIMYWFAMCLRELDCTLDQLTELNYDKLKDNGWKEARKTP